MTFTSRAFYGELRSELAALMKANGFKTAKEGRLGWIRTTPIGHTKVWFQCDKWGWDRLWGSRFTVEFEFEPAPEGGSTLKARCERIGYLLEGFEDLDELRIKNNAVIARLPGHVEDALVSVALADGSQFTAAGYVIDTERAVYGRDVWLNYYSKEDANDWGLFFHVKLPHYIDLFENARRSEIGLARMQYNEALKKAQAASDAYAKRKVLEAFLSDHPAHLFRPEIQEWLCTVDEWIVQQRTPSTSLPASQ
ncbi:MAG: hypothetical protein ACK5X5_06305 [bacterium]|jgi:hypothetical protein|nr:hypothetical protein [Betaproteobacteria bacterium]